MYVSIASLDWNQVEQTPRGEVYEVCDADEEGWALFMESEAPETKCGKMEWIDGRIAIVEFPSRERGDLVGAFVRCVTQNISLDAYLHPSVGGSTPRHLPYHEADLSYGPTSQGGGTLPPGIQWRDWDTLKLEIGYSRGWGHGPGQLDWKANQWAKVPGVNYILCVSISQAPRTNSTWCCIATGICLSMSQHALKLLTQS